MATPAQAGSGPNCLCPSPTWAFGDEFPPACGSSTSQSAGTKRWRPVARTLILAILHVGGGHPGQPFGHARRSGDPPLARKRSPAHLFGHVASAVALAARRRARVPHGHDGVRCSPRQRSRDAHRGMGQHWRHAPSAAALPTSGHRAPPPPPACAPPVQPQPPNPHPASQTAPKPKPKRQRPPKREPKSAPKPALQKRKRLPGESSSEESSSDSSTDSSSGSTTDSSAFEEPQPRPSAKEPTKPPRKAPKRAAPPQPKAQPPQPQPKAKPKARGGGVQIQSGGASVCSFSGQWAVEDRAGQRGPCRGCPPGVGETSIAFPKDPELFATPRASVWKTKTQAKKFLAKMICGRGGGQGGRRGRGRGGGREQLRGRGRGRRRGWTGGRFGCYRG